MAERDGAPPTVALVVRPGEESAYPVIDLVEHLLAGGWDAHLMCDARWALEPGLRDSLPADVARARAHPPPRPPGRRLPRWDTALAVAHSARRRPLATWRHVRPPTGPHRSLRAHAVAVAPRLVHLPSTAVARDWIEPAAALGARTLVSVRSDEASAGGPDFSEGCRETWARADALQVDSDALAALVREQSGATDVHVVEPAVDPELRARELAPCPAGSPLRLLGAGPVSWTQGYEHALAALRLLLDRGLACEYRIVGRGPHLDAVNFARHQLGLDEHVEIVEPGSPPALAEHLRWAGALVNAAVVPGSPQTVLDAQAVACPWSPPNRRRLRTAASSPCRPAIPPRCATR